MPAIGLPTAEQFAAANKGEAVLFTVDAVDQIRALVKLPSLDDTYLYVARPVDARVLDHLAQTREAVDEYKSLEQRRITFQLTFALIYIAVALWAKSEERRVGKEWGGEGRTRWAPVR